LTGFFGNRRKVLSSESSVSYGKACDEAAAKCRGLIRGWQRCRRSR